MNRKILTAMAAALLPAGLGLAQSTPPGTPGADGRLSKHEAAADDKLGRHFAHVDGNGDGYVDSGEYRRYARPKRDFRSSSAGE